MNCWCTFLFVKYFQINFARCHYKNFITIDYISRNSREIQICLRCQIYINILSQFKPIYDYFIQDILVKFSSILSHSCVGCQTCTFLHTVCLGLSHTLSHFCIGLFHTLSASLSLATFLPRMPNFYNSTVWMGLSHILSHFDLDMVY